MTSGFHTVKELITALLTLPMDKALILSFEQHYNDFDRRLFTTKILYGHMAPHPRNPDYGTVWRCEGELWMFEPEEHYFYNDVYMENSPRPLGGYTTVKELILKLTEYDNDETLSLIGAPYKMRLMRGKLYPKRGDYHTLVNISTPIWD